MYTRKTTFGDIISMILGFTAIIVILSLIGWGGYGIYSCVRDNTYYAPEKLDEALATYDFDRIHKIMNRMANEPKYNYEGGWFGPDESDYKKACKRAMSLEINYLVKDGEIERIEQIGSIYPLGNEIAPDVIRSQASAIMKHLANYNLDDLLILAKYLPLSSIVNKAISLDPFSTDFVQFLRRLPFDNQDPVTGHIEDKKIIELDQYINQQINGYNSACDVALEYAIKKRDRGLCKEILGLYKDDVIIQLVKGHHFSADEYEVYTTDSWKRRAAEKVRSM